MDTNAPPIDLVLSRMVIPSEWYTSTLLGKGRGGWVVDAAVSSSSKTG